MGQVKFLPEFLERYFGYARGVPQIYLLADSIERIGKRRMDPVQVSPMVFFTGAAKARGGPAELGNVACFRCAAHSVDEMLAVWPIWYAGRYGGEIITNYDQQRPQYQDAPFSLQKVMRGELNEYLLDKFFYIERADIVCETIRDILAEARSMSKIEVKLGDGTVIHGDCVVAYSIRDSQVN